MRKTPETEYLWKAIFMETHTIPIYFLSNTTDIDSVVYPPYADLNIKPTLIGKARKYSLYEYIGHFEFTFKNKRKYFYFEKLTKRKIAIDDSDQTNLYLLGDGYYRNPYYHSSYNVYHNVQSPRIAMYSSGITDTDTYTMSGLYVTDETNKVVVSKSIQKILKSELIDFIDKQQQSHLALFQDLKEDESETLSI